MLDYKYVIDYCVKFQISIEAWFFCYLLYLEKVMYPGEKLASMSPKVKGKSARPLSQIYRYAQLVRMWDKNELDRLVKKGYLKEMLSKEEIEHRNKGGIAHYIPDYLEVTDSFANEVMATYPRFQQLWDAYPASCDGFYNSAERIMLKACVKDEVETLYYKCVKTKDEHERVMQALGWALENSKITMNIKNFIGGENWLAYLAEMEDGGRTGSTFI